MITPSFKWALSGAAALLLCSCASTDMNVVSQTSNTYAPTPVSHVYVSSHPPKGQYIVIASLTTSVQQNETPTHLINRLRQEGASLGADYVLMTSVTDKTFLTPQNDDVGGNIYLATQRNFDSTANSGNNVGIDYTREIVRAQVLKMTSGSNKPNKAAPSLLWQQ